MCNEHRAAAAEASRRTPHQRKWCATVHTPTTYYPTTCWHLLAHTVGQLYVNCAYPVSEQACTWGGESAYSDGGALIFDVPLVLRSPSFLSICRGEYRCMGSVDSIRMTHALDCGRQVGGKGRTTHHRRVVVD
jgi:hypothetical protein